MSLGGEAVRQATWACWSVQNSKQAVRRVRKHMRMVEGVHAGPTSHLPLANQQLRRAPVGVHFLPCTRRGGKRKRRLLSCSQTPREVWHGPGALAAGPLKAF